MNGSSVSFRVLAARLACLGLLLAVAGPVHPQDPGSGGGLERKFILNSDYFMSGHPDLKWRREGVWALEQGKPAEAAKHFRRAAEYADKPSQAMLAEMYWSGIGVPRDTTLAYAWMDLAAERAYPLFLAKREHYWKELDEAARLRVQEAGMPLYEKYGDAVAKPRLERLLDRARRNMTGSRVGFVGPMRIYFPLAGDIKITIPGHLLHDDQFWRPEEYWAWQDRAWKEPTTGQVDILPIEVVRDREAGAKDRSPPDDDLP